MLCEPNMHTYKTVTTVLNNYILYSHMYCINHVKVTYFYCYYVYSKLNKTVIFLFNEIFDMHFEVLSDLIVHISNYQYPKCPIDLLALCGSYYFTVCIFIIVKKMYIYYLEIQERATTSFIDQNNIY